MNRRLAIASLCAVFTALFTLTFAVRTRGGHAWMCTGTEPYKFADAAINWYNGGTGEYADIYQKEAIVDGDCWDTSVITVIQVGSPGNQDQINSYNGYYGFTGWLGLATIYPSGCTIIHARTDVNQTYLDSGSYTRVNKEHVACQEVGHTFGLAHQYAPDTCMNDSILTAPQPNGHDRDQLAAIYGAPPPPPPPPSPTPTPGCNHNGKCYPSLRQCQAECCGVCERRINCGGATAHKCFE